MWANAANAEPPVPLSQRGPSQDEGSRRLRGTRRVRSAKFKLRTLNLLSSKNRDPDFFICLNSFVNVAIFKWKSTFKTKQEHR